MHRIIDGLGFKRLTRVRVAVLLFGAGGQALPGVLAQLEQLWRLDVLVDEFGLASNAKLLPLFVEIPADFKPRKRFQLVVLLGWKSS